MRWYQAVAWLVFIVAVVFAVIGYSLLSIAGLCLAAFIWIAARTLTR